MKSIVIDEDMNIKEVFVQVGDPDKEHKELVRIFCKVSNDFGNGNFCDVDKTYFLNHKKEWIRPEDFPFDYDRPAFKLTEDKMGTDCSMEYVAALSACALLYKKAFEHGHWDDNGDDLLQMAIRLFEWADRN